MEVKLVHLVGGRVSQVDYEDYERLSSIVWYSYRIGRTWYAMTDHSKSTIYMHRLVLNAAKGMEVDHVNGDGLDSRRCNLRIVTHQQNIVNQRLSRANTSGYKGVSYYKRDGVWVAQTKNHGRQVYLGRYDTPEKAARAYDAYMLREHGEFARLNFPEESKRMW